MNEMICIPEWFIPVIIIASMAVGAITAALGIKAGMNEVLKK